MSESYAAGRSYNALLVTQKNLDISTSIVDYIGEIQQCQISLIFINIHLKVSPEGMWRLNYDSRHGSWDPSNETVFKRIDDGVLNYGSRYEKGKNGLLVAVKNLGNKAR